MIMVPIFDRSLQHRLADVDLAPAAMAAVEAQRSKLAAIELPARRRRAGLRCARARVSCRP
ncbi:MAG TPA: hypothetical protein VF059_10235 [Casimicrobiaceae bacterium]